MKLILERDYEDIEIHHCNTIEEFYNKHYKKDGWLLDKDYGEHIHRIIDIDFMPRVGDLLLFRGEDMTVIHSMYAIEEGGNGTYYSKSRIIVECI
jgi:hypothetical protein